MNPPLILGIIIGLVIGLVVGLVVGFLIGTRAKEIINAVQKAGKALITLKELIKAGADDGKDDGEDDNEIDYEDVKEAEMDILDKYLSTDVDYGLDDHPDVIRNPIIMYQVKLAKEAARLETRRMQLIAEGMDEDEVDNQLMDEANGLGGGGGGGGGGSRMLATLISVGARVKLLEAAAERMRKRRTSEEAARTIEVYLQKDRGSRSRRQTVPRRTSPAKRRPGRSRLQQDGVRTVWWG